MSKSHQDVRQWTGALLFAAMAIAALAPTASATTEQPATKCPPAAQELVAALDAEIQVLIAHTKPLLPAVQVKLAGTVDRWQEAADAKLEALRHEAEMIELDVLRHEAEAIELGAYLHEADAVELEVTLRDVAAADRARAWAALDRTLDTLELRGWQDEWDAFVDERPAAKSPLIRAGIDMIVSLARVPARAALTARHLVEAFAKVTPRVLRVLA